MDKNVFDEFYQKKMDHKMKNGESFNDVAESIFTLEEKERDFGRIEIDDNDDLWIVDLDNPKIRIKVENMDDFYAFLAKYKLLGEMKKNE